MPYCRLMNIGRDKEHLLGIDAGTESYGRVMDTRSDREHLLYIDAERKSSASVFRYFFRFGME